jgi:hypothetical protein
MSDSRSDVRLGSTDALVRLKQSLARFEEEAKAVVVGTDMELRRAWHWLDREMPAHWESRIKRLEFELSEARNAHFRKRLQAQGTGHAAYDTAEKEAVRRTERLLEEARAKLPVIRRWRTQLERAIDEYNARVRGIRDQTEGGVDRHIELLNRLSESIDAYSSIGLPREQASSVPAPAETVRSDNQPESQE